MFEKNRKKPRKLEDVEVDEVSFVDNPANRKKFYLIKRNKKENKMEDLKVSKINDMFRNLSQRDLSKEDLEKVSGVFEELNKAEEAADLINQFTNDMPKELQNAIGIYINKLADTVLSEKEIESEDDKEKDEAEGIEKVGARFSKKTLDMLKQLSEGLSKATDVIAELLKEQEEKEEESKNTEAEKSAEGAGETKEANDDEEEASEDSEESIRENLKKMADDIVKEELKEAGVESEEENPDENEITELTGEELAKNIGNLVEDGIKEVLEK